VSGELSGVQRDLTEAADVHVEQVAAGSRAGDGYSALVKVVVHVS